MQRTLKNLRKFFFLDWHRLSFHLLRTFFIERLRCTRHPALMGPLTSVLKWTEGLDRYVTLATAGPCYYNRDITVIYNSYTSTKLSDHSVRSQHEPLLCE